MVPMWNAQIKRGKKEEVKVLITKDKWLIKKKLIIIRRYLGMDISKESL